MVSDQAKRWDSNALERGYSMVDLHLGFNGELGCSIPAEPDAVLSLE